MAAVKPENREVTLSYPGGTVTCVRGLMTYLFPKIKYTWTVPTGTTPRGRRRSYYSRRRTNADAGQPLSIHMESGDVWQVRITGTPLDFINALIASTDDSKIAAVYSERGTNFLPKAEPLEGLQPAPNAALSTEPVAA
jgi:hypothetical protein